MNHRTHTLLMVGIASALALLAWLTRPAPGVDPRAADLGAPLTPALTDPAQVASLEIIAYDDQAARHAAFRIEFDGQRWTIPSAAGFPADDATKIARAASMFVGLTREAVVTDARLDHAELGLVDPTDESGDPAGRGVRVTITDAQGRTLADLVIGHSPPGEPGRRFVRLASSDRAYRTSFQAPPGSALSVNLADWIDPDLLRVAADSITRIELDASTVDETRGQRVEGERFAITRQSPDDPWRLDPDGPPVNQRAAGSWVGAIAGLRLIGVEPMPRKLTRLLTGDQADVALDAGDIVRLQRAGFFLSPQGRLIANAGNLTLRTVDGFLYTLWFGEITDAPTVADSVFEPGDADARPAPDARLVLVTVQGADPDDEAAATEALERSRRLSRWWPLIEDASSDRLRPGLTELLASPEAPGPGQPAP
jgi:hypothetical protein